MTKSAETLDNCFFSEENFNLQVNLHLDGNLHTLPSVQFHVSDEVWSFAVPSPLAPAWQVQVVPRSSNRHLFSVEKHKLFLIL